MKTLFNLSLGIFLLLFTSTCNQINDDSLVVTGILKQQGITTYQYGSHTLSGERGFYALTSTAVDLDLYIGKEVSLQVEKVEGYPVDGGPVYLRVLKVMEK